MKPAEGDRRRDRESAAWNAMLSSGLGFGFVNLIENAFARG